MVLFDQLIFNVDRHLNDVLVTQDFDLRLIDHSRSFRPWMEIKDPKPLTRFPDRCSTACRNSSSRI